MSPARETPDVPLEQRLRESEARFRVMADCAPVLLWMAGTDARCDFFNKTWLDFTGRSLEQEAGYGWAEGIHPEDVQTCMDTYLDAFNARRPFMMEYRLRRADGAFRWVLDTGTPRFSPTGEFLGFIGSCVDITDRKGLEGEIRALNRDLERRVQDRTRDLEEANRNLESFSVSVSHDLRAPLRRIVNYAQILRETAGGALDGEGRRALDVVGREARVAWEMIEGLLNFSRYGRASLNRVEVDLDRLVREVREEMEPGLAGRAVEWTVEPLPPARGDPILLRIVFQNLIANAVKFTRGRDPARISVGPAGEREGLRVIRVEDNGAGFDPKFAENLFGLFQRLHSEREFEGLGVGLANVKRIVERHGGKAWAEGRPGEGAAFYVAIPR